MKTMTTSLALLAAIALTVGCQRGGDTDIGETTQRVKAQNTGPEQYVIKALFSLDLRPEQRKELDNLVADVQLSTLPVKQAMADLMREAGKQIRAGKINEERIRILAENLKGEYSKARPTIVASLNQVHKSLDQAQRQQLVDTLRDQHKARMQMHMDGDDKRHGFHGRRHGHGPGHMRGRHKMRRIAEKLGLSKQQKGDLKDVIEQSMAAAKEGKEAPAMRRENHRKKLRAAVDAFVSDSFDAAKLPLLDKPHGPGLEKLGKILKMGKLILPIFSDEQRDKIATHLEFRADIVAPADN